MRKSFFLSILAVGALVAGCAKSEVVDSKYGNDAIGFESYIGRDAMTKATVVNENNIGTAGLYGFYTAGSEWTPGATANLWVNEPLNCAEGTVTDVKYWTNDKDNYTFFAYAPIATQTNNLQASTGQEIADPTVVYTVPPVLRDQIDLTYAQVRNTSKEKVDAATSKKVDMVFKHALARLTVKAAKDGNNFEFDVKEINIVGNFITEGTFKLSDNSWTATDNDKNSETYVFYKNEVEKTVTDPDTQETTTIKEYAPYNDANKLTDQPKDYAGSDNYLMMIPVDFSTNAAEVTVKYTTFYANQESTVNTATFNVNTKFEQGKAYSINLTFKKEVEAIEFNVTVDDWKESTTDAEGNVTDDHEQDEDINA